MPFEVRAPDVEELAAGHPSEVAAENARRKALDVAGGLVLGADTVVACDGEILPKPRDGAQARDWLRRLSGRSHEVFGGLCLADGGARRETVVRTAVRFRRLDTGQLEWYLASGEWRERAGGYAIQGRGAALVAEIEGDYLNVVGLSARGLAELLPAAFAGSG